MLKPNKLIFFKRWMILIIDYMDPTYYTYFLMSNFKKGSFRMFFQIIKWKLIMFLLKRGISFKRVTYILLHLLYTLSSSVDLKTENVIPFIRVLFLYGEYKVTFACTRQLLNIYILSWFQDIWNKNLKTNFYSSNCSKYCKKLNIFLLILV